MHPVARLLLFFTKMLNPLDTYNDILYNFGPIQTARQLRRILREIRINIIQVIYIKKETTNVIMTILYILRNWMQIPGIWFVTCDVANAVT